MRNGPNVKVDFNGAIGPSPVILVLYHNTTSGVAVEPLDRFVSPISEFR